MKKFLKNKVILGSAGLAALAMSASANAAVDVGSVVTEITSNQAAIVSVGGAGLVLYVAAKVFSYIKRAV